MHKLLGVKAAKKSAPIGLEWARDRDTDEEGSSEDVSGEDEDDDEEGDEDRPVLHRKAARKSAPVGVDWAPEDEEQEEAESSFSGDEDAVHAPELLRILDEAHTLGVGTFACGGPMSDWALPGLHIKSTGSDGLPRSTPVPLPISEPQAVWLKRVAQLAPFGRRDQTVVDAAIRLTWQLSSDQFELRNPGWTEMLGRLVKEVAQKLGVSSERSVEAHLYKLLLYEAGSKFVPHRDTEKAEGMFATLTILLPSVYAGGEFVAEHGGEAKRFDFSAGNPYRAFYAAFYANVRHEVCEVTSGYRLALVYNLLLKNDREQGGGHGAAALPEPVDRSLLVRRLQTAVQAWADDKRQSDKKVYVLRHKYTQASLSSQGLSALHLEDRAVVDLLAAANEGTPLHVVAVLLTRQKEHYSCDVRDKVACLTPLVGPDQGLKESEFHLDVAKELLQDADTVFGGRADRERREEETGNEGASITRWYHRAVLIIWPASRNPAVLCACGQARAAFDQVNRAVDAAVRHKGEERALREAEAGALVLLDILNGDALLDLIPDLSKLVVRMACVGGRAPLQRFLTHTLHQLIRLFPGMLPNQVKNLVIEACGSSLGAEADQLLGSALVGLLGEIGGSICGVTTAVQVVRVVAGLECDGEGSAAEAAQALLAWLLPEGGRAPEGKGGPTASGPPQQRLQQAVQALGRQQVNGREEGKKEGDAVARVARWALCQRLAAALPRECAAPAPRGRGCPPGGGLAHECLGVLLKTLAGLGRAADVRLCAGRAAASWGRHAAAAEGGVAEAVEVLAGAAAELATWLGGREAVQAASTASTWDAALPAEGSVAVSFAEAASACAGAVGELTRTCVRLAAAAPPGSVPLDCVLDILQAADTLGDRNLLLQAVASVASAAPADPERWPDDEFAEAAQQLPQKLVQLCEDHGWAALQPGLEEAAGKLLAHRSGAGGGSAGGALAALRLVDGLAAAAEALPLQAQHAARSSALQQLGRLAVEVFMAQQPPLPPAVTRPGHVPWRSPQGRSSTPDPQPSELIALLLTLCARVQLDAATVERLVARLAALPALFPLRAARAPAALTLLRRTATNPPSASAAAPSEPRGADGVDNSSGLPPDAARHLFASARTLAASCIQELSAATQASPQPPTSWALRFQVKPCAAAASCSLNAQSSKRKSGGGSAAAAPPPAPTLTLAACEKDCRRVNDFLRSATAREFRLGKSVLSRHRHLRDKLTACGCMSEVTAEQVGGAAPYDLLLTKRHASYDKEAKQHSEDARLLAELQAALEAAKWQGSPMQQQQQQQQERGEALGQGQRPGQQQQRQQGDASGQAATATASAIPGSSAAHVAPQLCTLAVAIAPAAASAGAGPIGKRARPSEAAGQEGGGPAKAARP